MGLGLQLQRKEKAASTSVLVSFCFLSLDAVRPAASCSRSHDFPTMNVLQPGTFAKIHALSLLSHLCQGVSSQKWEKQLMQYLNEVK